MSIAKDLDQLTDELRAVVRRQQADRDPAHEDFYAWGWALSEVTATTNDVGRVLAGQVRQYGDRRVLRDDEGGDPDARLDEAAEYLDQMAAALWQANEAARLYHSAVGHIAVEVDPEVQA